MKTFLALAYGIMAGAMAAAAAELPDTIKLWSNGAPNAFETGYSAETINRNNLEPDPIMILFPAENPNGQAIVACPGGGYEHLAKYNEGLDMAQWFNDQGITYAVLLYRMPEGHNDVPLSDAQQALRIMRSKADELGFNSLGIMGSSAGGHLASTAATHFADAETRPDFHILFYPVISLDPSITHAGTRRALLGERPDPKLNWCYSNDTQVTPQTPPAFIMLSEDDVVVHPDNSIRYYQALRQAGVPVQLSIFPVGNHGWGFGDRFPYKDSWTNSLKGWLEKLKRE